LSQDEEQTQCRSRKNKKEKETSVNRGWFFASYLIIIFRECRAKYRDRI